METIIKDGRTYHVAPLRSLKLGTFFTLKPFSVDEEAKSSCVYSRSYYEPTLKKYSCHKFDDVCKESFFKGDRIVYVDFIF